MIFYLRAYLQFSKPLAHLKKGMEQLAPHTITALPASGPNTVREATEAINKLQERVVNLTKERDIIFAALSHDIKTPLTRLTLKSNILQNDSLKQKMLRDLNEINYLLDQMLIFVKHQHPTENKNMIDIKSLINTVITEFQDMKCTVFFEKLNTGIFSVLGQTDMLKWAFTNLLDNAIKYGQVANVKLNKENQDIIIMIEDDGPGLNLQEIDKVFNPFFRSKDHINKKITGSGLGLSIAKSIIDRHLGTIQLVNRSSKGLKVIITLPAI